MTHTFTIPQDTYNELEGQRRHLFVKDSAKYATGDTALIQTDEGREQLYFQVVSIDHGPTSKHVNGHYALLGLYAPYASIDDIPASVGGGYGQVPPE